MAKGVCWNPTHGAKEVVSQGVADVVEAARDERFGDAIPPPLDAHESYTAFLQRVPPRAGLLSEVIASRASRSTMIGLHTRYTARPPAPSTLASRTSRQPASTTARRAGETS